MKIEFSKYEGAGNDFVIIDNRESVFSPAPATVAALCDRRFGIGADGLMLLEHDSETSFRMRYFNSDGPEATMCGNGGRCISLFAVHAGAAGERMNFDAVDGRHTATLLSRGDNDGIVSLGMADASEIVPLLDGYFVNTGSPHYVRFVPSVDEIDVFAEGRRIRNLPEIVSRGGANINFVERTGDPLRIRTYERGVEDETLACGTGSVAAAITAAYTDRNGRNSYAVVTRGGALTVTFDFRNGRYTNIKLTGPARRTFTGCFDTENF